MKRKIINHILQNSKASNSTEFDILGRALILVRDSEIVDNVLTVHTLKRRSNAAYRAEEIVEDAVKACKISGEWI